MMSYEYDALFSSTNYGFRPNQGPQKAVNQFIQHRDNGYHWIAYIDIKDCFPSIDPNNIYPLIDKKYLPIPGFKGLTELPQGHPISPILSNIWLDQFDKQMEQSFPGKLWDEHIQLIRYVDDIWLLSRKKNVLDYCTSIAISALEDLGFRIRLQMRHVNQGIDALGFTITRRSIRPKDETKYRLKQRLIGIICSHLEETKNATTTNSPYLKELDDLYNGWSNYYGREAWLDCLGNFPILGQWLAMMGVDPELLPSVLED